MRSGIATACDGGFWIAQGVVGAPCRCLIAASCRGKTYRNFRSTLLALCCRLDPGCYISAMFRRAHKLLSLVLVLLIAVGPIGGAMANSHVCDPATGEASDSMSAAEHARHQASNEGMAQDQQAQCSDCASGCCTGGACSTHACGAGAAALLTHATTMFANLSSSTTTAESQLSLAERHSPPFRPPQV